MERRGGRPTIVLLVLVLTTRPQFRDASLLPNVLHWMGLDGRGSPLNIDAGLSEAGQAAPAGAGVDYTSIHIHHLLDGVKSESWHDEGDQIRGNDISRKELTQRVHVHISSNDQVASRILADRERKAKFADVHGCNFCTKCALTDAAEDSALALGQLGGDNPFLSMYPTYQDAQTESWKHYARHVDTRAGLPNCTKCKGCDTMLNELQTMRQEFKGRSLAPTEGRSRSLVYRVSSPQAKHGVAIGKVLCLPYSRMERNGKDKLEPCDENFASFLKDVQYPVIRAADLISLECGLDEVAPRTWVQNVTALMPGTGYVIETEMLLQDVVKGVSLNSIHRHLSDHEGEKLLASINSTTVILSAIFDLLLTSEDRHNDNVLIDGRGHMHLIDSDKVLGLEHGIPQSLFFPTSVYMWYNLFGRGFVNTHGKNATKEKPNYSLMLDYRCHVRSVNGHEDESYTLGTNYPPRVKRCLQKMDVMSTDELLGAYGLPSLESARMLKGRVHDMLYHGFEEALEKATPLCQRWPWTKPCCVWKGSNGRNRETCADSSWKPETWSLMTCEKVSSDTWLDLHAKKNWDYIRPGAHVPSIEERAMRV